MFGLGERILVFKICSVFILFCSVRSVIDLLAALVTLPLFQGNGSEELDRMDVTG